MVSLDDGRNNGIHQLLSVYIYNKYAFQYDVYRPLWWSPLDVSTGWGVVPYPSKWRPPLHGDPHLDGDFLLMETPLPKEHGTKQQDRSDTIPPRKRTWDQAARQ